AGARSETENDLCLLPRDAGPGPNPKRPQVAARFQACGNGCFGRQASARYLFLTLFFCQFYRRPVKYKPTETEKTQPMKTDQQNQSALVFLQMVSVAVAQLKQRLQRDYEQAYPDLREIIHLVLDEEEANAWELSLFPHLLLP